MTDQEELCMIDQEKLSMTSKEICAMTSRKEIFIIDQGRKDSGRFSCFQTAIFENFEPGLYIVLMVLMAFRYSINTTDWVGRRLMILFVFFLFAILGVHDWKTERIPDALNGVVLLAGLGDWLFFHFLKPCFADRLLGFFCVSMFLFLVSLMSRGGIGGGDIKLMAAAGFLCGVRKIVEAAIIGFYISGVYAVFLLFLKKASGKAHFPLGPFLCLGIGWMLGS